jgi:hypothetical protein
MSAGCFFVATKSGLSTTDLHIPWASCYGEQGEVTVYCIMRVWKPLLAI